MLKRIFLFLATIAVGTWTVSAQVKVSGTVLDKDGLPVIGAGVVEQGTRNGDVTGLDGNFSLTVQSGQSVLEITCIGYETAHITVGTRSRIDVVLQDDSKILDEVLVIGYGAVKKKDLTGAVANVDGGRLADRQSQSLAQALQGSMPGVQVTRTSGLPGAGATIRVRGVTTIGDSDPLVIVDGVPVSNINDVDVDAIDNINVLKDAASASIYGARASAGVILITTKRAKKGQVKFDYNGNYGVVSRTTHPTMVDPIRYMEMTNEYQWNDAGNNPGNEYFFYSKAYIDNYYENHAIDPDLYPLTDWDELMVEKIAPMQKHRVQVSYGNDVIKTNAMVSYNREEALYVGRYVDTFSSRINNDIKINNFISASFDVSVNRKASANNIANPVQAAYKYAPTTAAVYQNGGFAEAHNGTNTYARIHSGGFDNTDRDTFFGKASVTITPFKDFTITGVLAPQLRWVAEKKFIPEMWYCTPDDKDAKAGHITNNETTSLEEARTEAKALTKQLLLNYSKEIGDHSMTFMAGYEDYYAKTESLKAGTDYMELTTFPYLDRGNKNYITNSGNASENAYRSYFGRITYDYKGRYLLQANIRRDGSSRFWSETRWGTFPSVSLGWVATEEPFVKNLNLRWMDFLKVRASYGTLGNEKIGNYPYQAIMDLGSVLMSLNDGTVQSMMTAAQQTYAIRDITWETSKTWNLGLDAALFGNRLNIGGDIYRKNTYNMLLALEIPDLIGYGNPEQNAGDMHTNGWEIQVGWQDRIGDFTYAVSANLSDYTSIMGKLSGYQSLGSQIIREGDEYKAWYGYKSAGLFQTADEVATSPVLDSAVKPGDIKYLDISGPDGVPDGVISPEYDRTALGGSTPHYQYGGTINLGWKNWDLAMTFAGIGKVNVMMSRDMVYPASWHNYPVFYDESHWQYPSTDEIAARNLTAKYPRMTNNHLSYNYETTTDFWMFNGAYFRLKNVTLSYMLPHKITKRLNMQKVRAYISTSDPLTFSGFPQGWDPESYSNVSAYIVKTYTAGLQLTF